MTTVSISPNLSVDRIRNPEFEKPRRHFRSPFLRPVFPFVRACRSQELSPPFQG